MNTLPTHIAAQHRTFNIKTQILEKQMCFHLKSFFFKKNSNKIE